MLLVRTPLPSGNSAIYRVDHDDLDAESARMYGTQVAHSFEGLWFFPGGWIRIPADQAAALVNQALELV